MNNLEIDISKLDKVYFNNQRVYNIVLNDKFIWVDKLATERFHGNSNSK